MQKSAIYELPLKNNPYSFFIYDSLYNNATKAQEIFIDQYSGAITGTRGGSDDMRHNFMGWLAKFHNSFHAGKAGSGCWVNSSCICV